MSTLYSGKLTLLCAILLYGCAVTASTPQTVPGAVSTPHVINAGPYPGNYSELASQYLRTHLKDPYSAHIESLTSPGQKTILFDDIGYYDVWASCIMLNARNSYGGYTEIEGYTMIFHNAVLPDGAFANDGRVNVGMWRGCEWKGDLLGHYASAVNCFIKAGF